MRTEHGSARTGMRIDGHKQATLVECPVRHRSPELDCQRGPAWSFLRSLLNRHGEPKELHDVFRFAQHAGGNARQRESARNIPCGDIAAVPRGAGALCERRGRCRTRNCEQAERRQQAAPPAPARKS